MATSLGTATATTKNNSNISQGAAVTKARARLEYLLDTSYTKIEELRQLLIKESNIQWKDCSKELDPVLNRQKSIHETVVRRLKEASIGSDDINKLCGKYNGRHVHEQSKNVGNNNNFLLTQVVRQSLPKSNTFPVLAQLPVLSKGVPKVDAVSESRHEEKVTAHLLRKYGNDVESTRAKDDRQWYGSLDRNVVQKKKRSPIDKARRHTKIVGSMATLETTDELQPDEQYKIGLPTLARFDHLTINPALKPRISPPPNIEYVNLVKGGGGVGLNTVYFDTTDSPPRPPMASPATDSSEKSSRSSEGNDVRIYLNETIKPFEMADYYKYSTKYRQGELVKADLGNGNLNLVGAAISVDNFNSTINPNTNVPKLPPRDTTAKVSSKKPGLLLPPVPAAAVDESDLSWVMDTPTFV